MYSFFLVFAMCTIFPNFVLAESANSEHCKSPLNMLNTQPLPSVDEKPDHKNPTILKIPFILSADCFIAPGENSCRVEFLKHENFPENTNIAVLEQVSVHMLSDDDTEQFNFSFSTYYQGNEYRYSLPSNYYVDEQTPNFQFKHNEIVHIYHDGCLDKDCSIQNGIDVTFEFAYGPILRSPIGQHFYVSGYYTYVERLTY